MKNNILSIKINQLRSLVSQDRIKGKKRKQTTKNCSIRPKKGVHEKIKKRNFNWVGLDYLKEGKGKRTNIC